MADTAVPITAGSGTNIDTRTEATNGNHRQVVVLGDPATNAGVAPVDVTAGLKVDLGTDNDVTIASLPLPSGAATSAKQDTGNTSLSSIDGKITAVNTGAVVVSSSALPTAAATSTKQSDGTQKTQVVDGSGNVIGATANALDVNIKSGAGSGGTAATDNSAFTAGTTSGTPAMGFYHATVDTVTDGRAATVALTSKRSQHATLHTAAGVETGIAAAPLQVSLANTGANSNKLLVTPDSVALPANQSVNVSQLAGTTTDTNSGTKSAGTLRVVLATDQPALTNKLLVTPDSVALPANQSVNVSQINGVTTLMGNGVTGTGSQRVTIASDNTAFSVNATLAAETTKVIGVVRTADGSGNLLVSAANALNSTGAGVLATQNVAQFDDVAPTAITENQFGNLRMSANRNLYGTIRDAAGNERGANVSAGNALLVDASATTQPVSYATTGSGTATGALRVELANNGTGRMATVDAVTAITNALPTGTNSIGKISDITTSVVPGTGATNLGKAEDAVHTTGDTGVAVLAVRDDTLNATSGTEGDYEMFHTTAEGALWVTQAPSITNGWATFNATSGDGSTALTNTAQQVKATVGTVGGWYIYNPNATATYVNFYNATSASVTVGTTNQQMVICIPATAGANVEFGNGITFATAISISATTTGGGNSAPATALEANIFYK